MPALVIGALRVDLGMETSAFSKGATQAQKQANQLAKKLDRIGKKMTKIGKKMTIGLTAPIVAFGVGAVRAAGDFETAMNRVQAVSGATAEEMVKLKELAKEMGRTTQFSASEAADALGFLAQAGFNAQEAMAALPGTLQLASSAQMELGQTADIVSNILSGYALEVDELGRVNDTLVKTFTSTNTNLEQLGEAMVYVGPVASAAGVAFEETAAAIGLMGNAGIQGSMAGTSLRGAISRILAPSAKAAGIMQTLGLKFTDAQGQLLPLVEVIKQLEPHANNAGLFMELFGQRAGPAMAALVSQGSDELSKLNTELINSGGTAERISKVQMEGFNGAMKRLKSAFEALQIAVAESGLLDFMAGLANKLSNVISNMAQFSPTALKIITVILAVVAAIGPLIIVIGSLISAIGSITAMMAGGGILATALGAIGAAILPITAAVAALAAGWYLFGDKIGPVLSDIKNKITDVLGPKIQGLISTISGVLTDLWQGPLGDMIRVVIDVLGDFGAAYLSVLGEGLVRVISAAVDLISGAFTQIGNIINLVIALLSGDWAAAWSAAGDIVNTMVNTILNVIESLAPGAIESVKKLYQGVKLWMQQKLGKVFSWVSDKVGTVGDAFYNLWDRVVGHSYVPDLLDGISHWFGKLDEVMTKPALKGTDATAQAFKNMQSEVMGLMAQLFPEANALHEFKKNVDLLSEAFDKGVISKAQYDEAMVRLNKEHNESTSSASGLAAALNNIFPERNQAMQRAEQIAALNKGLKDGKIDAEQYAEAISRISEASPENQQLNGVLDSIFPERAEAQARANDIASLNKGLDAGKVSAGEYAEAMKRIEQSIPENQQMEEFLDSVFPERSDAKNRIDDLDQLSSALEKGLISFQDYELGYDRILAATASNTKNATQDMIESFASLAEAAIASVQDIVSKFKSGDTIGAIVGIIGLIGEVIQGISGASGGGGGTVGTLGAVASGIGSLFGGGRRLGGAVVPGKTYRVGEGGSEYFTPNVRGMITPASDTGGGNNYYFEGNLLTPEFMQMIDDKVTNGSVKASFTGSQMALDTIEKSNRTSLRSR